MTVVVDALVRGTIQAGSGFGELALLAGDGKRTATIMTKSHDCVLLYIDKVDWNRIMKQEHKILRRSKKKLLKMIPTIDCLNEIEQDSICDCIMLRNEPNGSVLIHEGDLITSFFILVKGQISVWRRLDRKGIQVRLGTMRTAEYHGEVKVHKIHTTDMSEVELRCDTDCEIAVLSEADAYLKLPKDIEPSQFSGLAQHDVYVAHLEDLEIRAWQKTKRQVLDGIVRERFNRPDLTHKEFRGASIGERSRYRDLK